MTGTPVTLAGQGIFIEPDDFDDLIGLIADAAWVIGHLARRGRLPARTRPARQL